jgi:hypothetical protein
MKVTEIPAGTLADRSARLGEQHRAAGIAPFGGAIGVRTPVPLVTPGQKAPCEACLKRAAALEGLPFQPEPAVPARACRRLPVTAQTVALARSLVEICAATREASCGQCWQVPGAPCAQDPDGGHVARPGRAARNVSISGAERVAILRGLKALTTAAIVETPGGGSS